MKTITTILIIAVCLSLLVLPVLADKEGQDVHAGITVGAAESRGPSHEGDTSPTGPSVNRTSATLPETIAGNDQRDGREGNKTKPAERTGNNSPVPGLKNTSDTEHRAVPKNTSAVPQGWEKNKNAVRDAVHSLLALENRTGGIGPQISAIAREFNNSADAGRQYEDRIQNRETLSRILFGGDRQAAKELANLTAQNQARITGIENLINSSTLDADNRSRMDEQVQVLKQQVAQEQQLITQAQQDRGLFGWFG
jgi:hypothetical protein